MKEIDIKTPRQERSRRKFAAILAACPRVLREFGYRKGTAAKIALEAEVGIGTFYDYFSCKEAAYIAYLDDRLNRALATVAENVHNRARPVEATLRELISIGVDFAFEEREVIKLVFTQFPEEIRRISLEHSRQRLQGIALEFAEHKQLKLVGRDPDLMMYTLTNLVLGFQFRIVVMPQESPGREVMVDELSNMVLAYLVR